ncbi:hypothetical protein WN943_004046 [Citrus x changshan-huyou]
MSPLLMFIVEIFSSYTICILALKSCTNCGHIPVPYPLSTGPGCGDQSYKVRCNAGTLWFDALNGSSYIITSINPLSQSLIIRPPGRIKNKCIAADYQGQGLQLDNNLRFNISSSNTLMVMNCSIEMLQKPFNCSSTSICHSYIRDNPVAKAACGALPVCCWFKTGGSINEYRIRVRAERCAAYQSFVDLDLSLPVSKWPEPGLKCSHGKGCKHKKPKTAVIGGSGGFGEVFKAILDDGTITAVKRSKLGKTKGIDQILNEVRILCQLNHRSLVKLLGCCVEVEQPLLVYEHSTRIPSKFTDKGKYPIAAKDTRNSKLAMHPKTDTQNHVVNPNVAATSAMPLDTQTSPMMIPQHAPTTLDPLRHTTIIFHNPNNKPIDTHELDDAAIQMSRGTKGRSLPCLGDPPDLHSGDMDLEMEADPNYVEDEEDEDTTEGEDSFVEDTPMSTLGYLDPENYINFQLTDKSDVYSFGVVLVELLTSKKAVDFNREEEDVNLVVYFGNILKQERLVDAIDPMLKEGASEIELDSMKAFGLLAAACLDERRQDRPSIKEVADEIERIIVTVSSGD